MYHFHIHKKNIEKNGIITFRVSLVVRRFAELPRIKKIKANSEILWLHLYFLYVLHSVLRHQLFVLMLIWDDNHVVEGRVLGVCFNQINRPQKLIQKYINSKTQTQIILFWKGKF